MHEERSRQLDNWIFANSCAHHLPSRKALVDNEQMEDWAETDLAWQLAEIACLLLPDHDRIDLYTAIGAGYSYAAIGTLLDTVARAGVPVCPALVARIADWMTSYAHHPDAPRLREMLTAVRTAS